MLRVVLKPLIPVIPMIGGVQAFFLNCPILDFNLVGIADLLDFPGFKYVEMLNIALLILKLPIY